MKETKDSNTKNKIPKTNKGITLIALVITIIVMLILVGVTISMAVNGGLFDYAGKAVGDTNNAMQVEQQLGNGGVTIDGTYYNSIDEYLATKGGSGNGENNAEGDIQGIDGEVFTAGYTETKPYTDENGDIAVIPKGFSVGKSDGIDTIDGGLVIQDSEGNQFVWIPVVLEGETQEEKETSFEAIRKDGYESGSLQTLVSGKTVTEPFASGYADEEKEYKEMRTSVIENGGFYIGRYEAGIEPTYIENGEEKINSARTNVANGTSTMVVKRDCYPYNYVGWGASMSNYTSNITDQNSLNQGLGALALSKAMYTNKDVGVTSTLCYGIQWDAMVKFMGKDTETDSTEWGNYKNNSVTIDRETARWTSSPSTDTTWTQVEITAKDKSNSESILFTTGASDEFEEKNIYDVVGNVYEWTNEAYEAYSMFFRVIRGSHYNYYGNEDSVSSRFFCSPGGLAEQIGFRPVLYIS